LKEAIVSVQGFYINKKSKYSKKRVLTAE